MTKLLIICEDIVGQNMAGPAVRCVEFAKALAGRHDVTLAVPNSTTLRIEGANVARYDAENLPDLAAVADSVLVSGFLMAKYPFLRDLNKPLVVDIYDPFTLENLEIHSSKALNERAVIHDADLAVQTDSLARGDFFLCASEKQRDYWMGMLAALNRVNPYTYDADGTLRNLIDVAPFGLPASPPAHERSAMKGVVPGIEAGDKVLFWGGGIWNWFDPVTLIKAVAEIAEARGDVKLFFAGVSHPNPDIPKMRKCLEAMELSEKLRLTNKTVFFNEWIAYEDRQNFLTEADIGVSLHLDHLETKFSFRTRILDYLWAGLPIITTVGDSLAELVERENLGRVVDYQNVSEVKRAILDILDNQALNKEIRGRAAEVAPRFHWTSVVEPLDRFLKQPERARDLVGRTAVDAAAGQVASVTRHAIRRLKRKRSS